MINRTGEIEFRFDQGEPWIVGRILGIKYQANDKLFIVSLDVDGTNLDLPFIAKYFKDAVVDFLDEKVGIGAEICFIPKRIEDLETSGWYKNKKGRYIKPKEFYQIGKGKLDSLGQVLHGRMILDKNGNAVITYERWHFSPDMVKFVYADKAPRQFQPKYNIFGPLEVKRTEDGSIKVGDKLISLDQSLKLAKFLLEL